MQLEVGSFAFGEDGEVCGSHLCYRANASKSLFVPFLSKTLGVFSKHFVHPRDRVSAKSYNIKVYFLLYGTITNFVPSPR